MTDATLADLRELIEELAIDEGRYYVVCARTGHRRVPADGLRFETRAAARTAARATERYRARLRRYDPRLALYDPIVCQDLEPGCWAAICRTPEPVCTIVAF